MAEIRQNKFDRDPRRNGQIVETGKALLEKNCMTIFVYI